MNKMSLDVWVIIVVRKSRAPRADSKKKRSADNDADDSPKTTQFSQQNQRLTQKNVKNHVAHFGKPVFHGFVIFLQKYFKVKPHARLQKIQKR